MKINKEELDVTIKKLTKIKLDIKNSDHDRMSVEDFDYSPDDECVISWCEVHKLPTPPSFSGCSVDELPEEYWEAIFGDSKETPLTGEQIEEVMLSEEYKALLSLYDDVFGDLYTAASEEAAYYENEYLIEEQYENSMRGFI